MGRFFIFIHNFLSKKIWAVLLAALVFVALVIYSVTNLRTGEDFSALFPKEKNLERVNHVLQNSSFSDKIVVFFTAVDTSSTNKTDLLIRQADTFVDSLEGKYGGAIKDIKYKISDSDILMLYDFFYDNLPLFLDERDYSEIEKKISRGQVKTTLRKDLNTLISPAGIAMKRFILKDPLGFTPLAMKKINRFQVGDEFAIVENRIFSKDKNVIFIFITLYNSSDTRKTAEVISDIGKFINSGKHNGITGKYYGAPVIAAANAERIKKDIMLTVSLTLIFIFFFLSIYFRNFILPFLLFIPVIAGAGISIIAVYIFKGEISAISMGVGSVLLGIGIDYALHFFTHSRKTKSVDELLNDISIPILMSSITTASAFLCLFVVKSDVFQDLGFFASVSVISIAFATLIILPLVFKFLKKLNFEKSGISFPDRIASTGFEKSKTLVITILLLTIVFYFTAKKTTFNENLMDMNYMPQEFAEAERFLNDKTAFAKTSLYLAATGENIDKALENSERVLPILDSLKRAGIVDEYSSVSSILLTKKAQAQKIDRWNEFWRNRKEYVISTILKESSELKFKPGAFNAFFELLNRNFKPVGPEVFEKIKDLYFRDYIIDNQGLHTAITLIKADRNKREVIKSKIPGTETVMVFDRQGITEKLFNVIKSEFGTLVLLSSLIVFVILLLSFGRIELAVISFIPIVLSWVWTVGIMGIFGIRFNIFNIIISTFIFGLGVDYSIFITKGLLQKLQYGKTNILTFKTSILLSAITTVVGTGVLIFAKHPALKSIALVSVIGITSAVIITFTVLPLLFNFLAMYKGKKRALPVTFLNFFFSITSLTYFFLSTATLALVIIPVLRILPVKQSSKEMFVHRAIKFFSKTVVYHNIHVPKILVNINKHTFDKPVFVISNHQSMLDLVFLLMLHPKLLIVSNRRSLNNRFYGPAIRYTGFIFSGEGLDKMAGVIKRRMAEGYSVIIFPEGTRSANCKIKRFHKGAFYIAEKLNLTILPIMIHGACQALNKNEFFLRRGIVHIKAFDKVDFGTGKYGPTYREHTKAMQRFYREEFEKMNREVWIPDRLKYNLINRYIFRGPVLEWYMRIKLRLENNYNFINSLIPRNAVVTDVGCGYGFLSTMLALVGDERKITGIDYDENKILTAVNCTEDLKNLEFIHGDVLKVDIPQSDAIVISDVLHYMSVEKQVKLLEKCFAALNDGATMIVRDADADLRKRTKGTRITEFFSTRFGFNKTVEKLEFVSGKLIAETAEKFGLTAERIDDTKFTSNITYVLRKNG